MIQWDFGSLELLVKTAVTCISNFGKKHNQDLGLGTLCTPLTSVQIFIFC